MTTTMFWRPRQMPHGCAGLVSAATAVSFCVFTHPAPASAQDTSAPVAQQQREGAPSSPGSIDKSGYALFNPTPDDAMRPFSTDRPGKTHSTLTVDAEHIQIAGDIWNYTWDQFKKHQTSLQGYTLANPNLKIGIANWAELDFFFPSTIA